MNLKKKNKFSILSQILNTNQILKKFSHFHFRRTFKNKKIKIKRINKHLFLGKLSIIIIDLFKNWLIEHSICC